MVTTRFSLTADGPASTDGQGLGWRGIVARCVLCLAFEVTISTDYWCVHLLPPPAMPCPLPVSSKPRAVMTP